MAEIMISRKLLVIAKDLDPPIPPRDAPRAERPVDPGSAPRRGAPDADGTALVGVGWRSDERRRRARRRAGPARRGASSTARRRESSSVAVAYDGDREETGAGQPARSPPEGRTHPCPAPPPTPSACATAA